MKSNRIVLFGCATLLAGLLAAGCSSESSSTIKPGNSQPGSAVGNTVGPGVGVAAGNVAGVGTGVAGGVADGFSSSFKNENTHVIRRWRTETTADGRTIQVPEDILVDANGRPVGPVTPAPVVAPVDPALLAPADAKGSHAAPAPATPPPAPASVAQ